MFYRSLSCPQAASISVPRVLLIDTAIPCSSRKLAKFLSAGLGLLIILIGLSRVYVGVHYPTDIIGGWSLGIAVLVATIYAFEKFDSRSES